MKDTFPSKHLNVATTLRTTYFIWIYSIILLLTAIPLACSFVSIFLHSPLWTIPKIYELKMYLIIMAAAAMLGLSTRYIPTFFSKEYRFYYYYMALFLPIAALIYASSLSFIHRYVMIFLLALVGVGILIYNHGISFQKQQLQMESYNWLPLISVAVTIFIIVLRSTAGSFNINSSGYFPWCMDSY